MSALDLSPQAARTALAGLDRGDRTDDEVVEDYARVLWSTLTEPGDGVAHRLVEARGSVGALRAISDRRPPPIALGGGSSVDEIEKGLARWTPRLKDAAPAAAHALEIARRVGASLLLPGDVWWPTQLDDLGAHAPLCLWVRGAAGALGRPRPSVALVGARAATGYGELVAADLSAELGASGMPIVSGAAYGIDGAAHRAAVTTGGVTIALLAGGVDRAYPAGHADLLGRIVATGAVVSEVPCGSTPTKWRFLQRNRLIAALSDATVVVEAGWRSGSINTASHAGSLGRPVGAVPGPVTSAASAGCHLLLREYDARCITSAADVRELVGWSATADTRARAVTRTDDRTRVIDALSTRSWLGVDDLARRSGMDPADIEGHLGLLALDGTAVQQGGAWRRAASG